MLVRMQTNAGGGGSPLSVSNAKWETFSNTARTPVTISGLTGKARSLSFVTIYNNSAILLTWNEADGAYGTWNDDTAQGSVIEVTSVTDTSITFVVPTGLNLSWKGWIFY